MYRVNVDIRQHFTDDAEVKHPSRTKQPGTFIRYAVGKTVRELLTHSDYDRYKSVQHIPRLNIRVRTVTSADVRASEAIRVQEGVMTNDSVTVALMRKLGLRAI